MSSSECCGELLEPIGARALALGHAIVARPGSGSLFSNPAALADLGADQLVVHTATTSVRRSHVFSALVDSDAIGAIGITYRLVDDGEVEVTDQSGSVIGTLELYHHALTATYATSFNDVLRAGISYQLFQSRYDCRGFCGTEGISGTSHLLDAGVQYRLPIVRDLEIGASLLHVGTPQQFINAEQAAPTPARFRFGAAHEVLQHFRPDSAIALWLAADIDTPIRRPGSSQVNVGAELSIQHTVYVWAGYASGEGVQAGPGIGVGLHYDRFVVGVARSLRPSPVDDTGTYQVTFSIQF